MAAKYKKRILDYCAANGVVVPPGFGRNRPGQYAIIRTHLPNPKLIAATWSKIADVLYYIQHHLAPELGDALSASIRVLDFQTGEFLAYHGGNRLERISTFSLP